MSKVLFLEGIQGSGKSTLAKELMASFERNLQIKVVHRSSLPNPLDSTRLAFFTIEQFNTFTSAIAIETKSPIQAVLSGISQYVLHEDAYILINWHDYICRCGIEYGWAMKYALSHEICDGKASYQLYKKITTRRWKRFSNTVSANTVYIFEGVLFQHTLAELIGYYLLDDEEIESFILSLIRCLKGIESELYYISVSDVLAVLTSAAAERSNLGYSWVGGFLKMVSCCNYGIKHKLEGFDGAVEYCKERMRVEKSIMEKISIPTTILQREVSNQTR